MPGADQETNVPSSAETMTIAASETVLAEFALTLFLEVAGDLAQKLALECGTNRNRSASLIESALGRSAQLRVGWSSCSHPSISRHRATNCHP
jgi:hypothetical protein